MSAPLLFAMMHALEKFDGRALPPHHRLVLLVLADFADDAGKAWPSAATIAGRTGQSRSTVETVLGELEEAGWLVGERRTKGERYLSTVFEVKLSGGPVKRVREGRHSPRGGESDTPPGIARPACHAPHTMPRGEGTPPRGEPDTPPRDNDTPRGGEDPIRDPLRVDPPRESGAPARRTKRKPEQGTFKLEPSGPTPETPLEVLYRVIRELWAKKYQRKLVLTGQDEAALAALAKRGAKWCADEERAEPGDVERLLRWWVGKFLDDRGNVQRAGELGYLERTFHRPADLERGLNGYGTPWDRDERRARELATPPAVPEQDIGPRRTTRREAAAAPPADTTNPADIFGGTPS